MLHMVRQTARYLKNAWDQEPVIVVSFAFGITGAVGMWLSPYTYKQFRERENLPSAYNFYNLPTDNNRVFEHLPDDPSKVPVWRTDYDD